MNVHKRETHSSFNIIFFLFFLLISRCTVHKRYIHFIFSLFLSLVFILVKNTPLFFHTKSVFLEQSISIIKRQKKVTIFGVAAGG